MISQERQHPNPNNLLSLEVRKMGIVAKSQAMMEVLRMAFQIATVDCTVLILGESGVGKEAIAKLIHENSSNSDGPFVKVNCGAIPENLLESELFGYEYGAFTGAKREGKLGKFEMAHNGTILLDEIGDLPLHLQVKLLRVIQEREIIRIGANQSRKVNIRILAATNKDLREMTMQGKFREDLYYRLNVVPLHIPPLRERREDIMPLIVHFKKKYEKKYQMARTCSPEVVRVYLSYDWPGNVRELENVIERIYVMGEPGKELTPERLIKYFFNVTWQANYKNSVTVHKLVPLKEAAEEMEMQLISMAFKQFGTISKVAEVLNVDPSTISRKVKRLGKDEVFYQGQR
ncbi:sigma 54-interacting transcriptional regulator [Metallumcola ferriviriculae]|uniref:Sigma 54-interacting transcriptional regulator n=1 Tax=Metallumcola ferriviriculae TaxID=3039180 RepID=A0AAU0UNZ8_9FIRM|nr:sigma 54-interacting transcriptional regulator [Desulfitibacteraceae bacterium MK1]